MAENKRCTKRRRLVLLVLAAGVVGSAVALADAVESSQRRRWRGRDYSGQSEYWRRSRASYRASYRALSFGQGDPVPSRSSGVSRVPRSEAATLNYSATYSATGTLTEKQIYAFRDGFADGQSRKAMRSALGEPAESTPWGDTWKIQRVGIDGRPSGKYGTFEATYGGLGWDATAKPPVAKW